MKQTIIILVLILGLTNVSAQIPVSCLEIESILVDACGSPEGENEMVRFQVGPSPINLASFSVDWPNNPWLGLCQNATTASTVATWNSTVVSCGLLMEPTGGILPAGERVILVSSTNVIPGANSFAGLSDTIYVIFQCAGNTNGHFANYGVGLRTLKMMVGPCVDSVIYDRSLLEDPFGVHTAADGATVAFNWPGVPDYINIGCNAPVTPEIVDAGIDQMGFCYGDTVNLTGNTQGSFSSFNWTGGTGSFINPTSVTNASYVIGPGDVSPIQLYFSASNCNGSITDSIEIFLNIPTPVTITPGGPISFCTGDSVQLTAIGPGPFLWNTTSTASNIMVNSPGTYIVVQNAACGISADTVLVISNGSPPVASITPLGPTTLCIGDTLTLQGSGGTSFFWNTSEISSSINATLPGNYSLIVSNGCGSDTAYITISTNANPQANISPSSPIYLCGDSIEITVSGTGNFSWSNGDTGPTESYNAPGNYYVVASNLCGTDTAFFTILGGDVIAGFTASPISGSSPLPVNFTNTSINADTYSWIFGDGNTSAEQNPNYTYNQPGTYTCTLIATNVAGCSDTISTTITVDSCLYLIKVPNVITADGNSINDSFVVTATCVDQFNASFFDRWGLKVFEYNNASEGWNGITFSGSQVTQGVYTYVIYLKDFNGLEHEYVGFLHVFE